MFQQTLEFDNLKKTLIETVIQRLFDNNIIKGYTGNENDGRFFLNEQNVFLDRRIHQNNTQLTFTC